MRSAQAASRLHRQTANLAPQDQRPIRAASRSLSLLARLTQPAPVPPLALLRRKARISRLRHRRAECVQHADVLLLPGHAAKPFVKAFRVLPCQSRDGVDAQQLEIANHGGANRNEVSQFSCAFCSSLYIRLVHWRTISHREFDLQRILVLGQGSCVCGVMRPIAVSRCHLAHRLTRHGAERFLSCYTNSSYEGGEK
jgi:hypothetical protein